jgi:hypothetical protein
LERQASKIENYSKVRTRDFDQLFWSQFPVFILISILLAIVAAIPRNRLAKFFELGLYGLWLGVLVDCITLAVVEEYLRRKGLLNQTWKRSGDLLQWVIIASPSTSGLIGMICGMIWARLRNGKIQSR